MHKIPNSFKIGVANRRSTKRASCDTRVSQPHQPLPHRLVHLRVPGSNQRHTHAMLLYVLSGGLSQKICAPACLLKAKISTTSTAADESGGLQSRFHHLLQPIRDLAQNWNIDIAQVRRRRPITCQFRRSCTPRSRRCLRVQPDGRFTVASGSACCGHYLQPQAAGCCS
jgi:hypothetical protein